MANTYLGHTTTKNNADLDALWAAVNQTEADMSALVDILTPGVGGVQGRKTVTNAGTPLQVIAGSTPCRSLTITALPANTGKIAWGWSNAVKATVGAEAGAQLAAGESVTIAVTDVNKIWIDASVSTEGISFTSIT